MTGRAVAGLACAACLALGTVGCGPSAVGARSTASAEAASASAAAAAATAAAASASTAAPASTTAAAPASTAAAPASTASSPSAGQSPAGSGDPGCSKALDVISKYGPGILQDAVTGKEAIDKAEISLIVILLDGAANVAGRPDVKDSIQRLADAYLKFRGAWTGAVAPPVEGIVSQSNKLKSHCT